MVLGYLDKRITYPKGMYDSACAYGFAYHPGALAIEVRGSCGADEEWLCQLYGFTFERSCGEDLPENYDKDAAWNEYIDRICGYLKDGVPVITPRGWIAEQKGSEVRSKSGMRGFWWDGLGSKERPDTHFFVITGIDKTEGLFYMNDPIWGWFGKGRDETGPLSGLRKSVERQAPGLRYLTYAFRKSDAPPIPDKMVWQVVRQRIGKKIEGDSKVYDKPQKHYCHYGINGWRSFRKDLEPAQFTRILRLRKERQGYDAVPVLAWQRLRLYHHHFMAKISADYLEEQKRVDDWAWLVDLEVLYRQMCVANEQIIAALSASKDLDTGVAKAMPALRKMQHLVDRVIEHLGTFK